MPRNAAKKLINEEACLPKLPTTATKTQQLPNKQATQLRQRKKPVKTSAKSSKSTRKSKRTATKITSTPHPPSASETHRAPASTTTYLVGSTPNRRQAAARNAINSPLYPTVIEIFEQEVAAATTATAVEATKTSPAITTATTSAGATVSAVSEAKGITGIVGRLPVAGGRRLRKRRGSVATLTKRSKNKNKNKSLHLKIATRESCAARLATLRTRKAVTKTPAAPKDNRDELTSVILKNRAAWQQLNAAVLNRIETIECDVKKSSASKRKRGCSVTTRKRASTQKASNFNFPTEQPLQQCDSAALIVVPIVATVGGAPHNEQRAPTTITITPHSDISRTTTETGATATAIAIATTPTSAGKKRVRGMSVYERSSGVVTNGYLSSTRTSSASSSAVHSDADPQDITQQYYMPVVPASGGVVANAISSAPSAALTGGSSNNALNYAPSMATLCNIGNTCYLNSVVYTLRFAPQFLHNLHHLIADLSSIQQSIVRQRTKSSSLGRGMNTVQLESARSWSSKDLAALEQNAIAATAATGSSNAAGGYTQKSSHQLLTERLHELYQSLHRNEVAESTEPFHADTLLHAIQDVSSIFEGNQQQDAHEFLMCVLNSIRETCQTLIKAISECPDIILNGYIRGADELDGNSANALDRDTLSPNSHSGGNGSVAPPPTPASSSTSSSSLSASNITKALFSSRKAKRKEEAKNAKNSRLQSPLKDVQSGGLQPTSNSLFYLNSVDLSGASSSASSTSVTKSIGGNGGGGGGGGDGGGGDGDISPVSLLKDKERLAEKIRELGLDFFSEDFEGVTVSTTKCLSCETVTEQKESMIDIAVPVPISGYDSSDYTEKPSSFIQNSCITREYFRGENKYRCEQCTGYTEAIRSISYEVLPRLLIIQLSRFSGGMEKINSYIPTSFTLQCFCAKCCELSDANKLHIYKLYSVITHVGATMSVGHYIAYTCSLDWANEYVNCPKDRRMASQQQANCSANGLPNNGLGAGAATGVSAGRGDERSQSTQASSAASLMKKMKFGRSKASSSGDMSKNMKSLNGLTSKAITNGIGKLSMNTSCHSLNCCATRLCSVQQQQLQLNSNSELSEEGLQNGANHTGYNSGSGVSNNIGGAYAANCPPGYGSTGRGGSKIAYGACNTAGSGDPIWYMCDDDKIKAMTQREFEELLSPARKITVTPYLLFYARFDLQTSQPLSAKSTGAPATTTAAQAPSWSNESLLSGSAASSSISTHKM